MSKRGNGAAVSPSVEEADNMSLVSKINDVAKLKMKIE